MKKSFTLLLMVCLVLLCSCSEKEQEISENVVNPDFVKEELDEKIGTDEIYKDSTFIILSNRDDITFDDARKACGYSSNMDDYFKPEDAIFVAVG